MNIDPFSASTLFLQMVYCYDECLDVMIRYANKMVTVPGGILSLSSVYCQPAAAAVVAVPAVAVLVFPQAAHCTQRTASGREAGPTLHTGGLASLQDFATNIKGENSKLDGDDRSQVKGRPAETLNAAVDM